MATNRCSRRAFLHNLAALSSMGLASRLDLLNVVASASAQEAGDYKALVCVFMFGGNDGNNTLIPIDGAGYAQYAAARPAASGINLAQASLLPIHPVNSGTPFGLHPALAELQTLFNSNKMAVLANVGTLVQPITKAQYASGLRPLSLYSHSDQQAQWQSSISDAASGTGWGGRVADKVSTLNAASGFPVVTSLGGTVLFTTGTSTSPLAIPATGSFALAGYTASAASKARLAAVQQLLRARVQQHPGQRRERDQRAGAAVVDDRESHPGQRQFDDRFTVRTAEDQHRKPTLPGRQADRGARGDRCAAADLFRAARELRHARRPDQPAAGSVRRTRRRRSRPSTTRRPRSVLGHR